MISIQIDIDKKENLKIIAWVHKDLLENRIIKRCLLESDEVKGRKNTYKLPEKFLFPILNNLDKKDINIKKGNVDSFLEFSDEYDEQYFYAKIANAKFMRKWREVGCPNVYKVKIDFLNNSIEKYIAFKINK